MPSSPEARAKSSSACWPARCNKCVALDEAKLRVESGCTRLVASPDLCSARSFFVAVVMIIGPSINDGRHGAAKRAASLSCKRLKRGKFADRFENHSPDSTAGLEKARGGKIANFIDNERNLGKSPQIRQLRLSYNSEARLCKPLSHSLLHDGAKNKTIKVRRSERTFIQFGSNKRQRRRERGSVRASVHV
jgi:hypothetical protein